MDNGIKISVPVIISVIIMSVVIGAFSGWIIANRAYMSKSMVSQIQLSINENIRNEKYPTIQAKNMRIKQGTNFSIKEHVQANDVKDGNITSSLEFYGTVDTSEKGLYEVRCVVRNSLGLKTVKTVQIIVD